MHRGQVELCLLIPHVYIKKLPVALHKDIAQPHLRLTGQFLFRYKHFAHKISACVNLIRMDERTNEGTGRSQFSNCLTHGMMNRH